jgi:undecaprenyl-diphosphatase
VQVEQSRRRLACGGAAATVAASASVCGGTGILELWKAVVLGVVEGITEFLPVSSTGHLILAAALLHAADPAAKSAQDAYLVVLQGGAVLAVLGLYSQRVLEMLQGLLGRSAAGLRLVRNLLVAFLPAVVAGLLFEERIERWLFHPEPVLAALFLGGVWMIWLSRPGSDPRARAALEIDDLDWRRALGIGLFQCLALWPGTSRSMATIAGGVLLGLRPREAAEFSFLLGVPTLGGATAYKLLKGLGAGAASGPTLFDQLGLATALVGMAVAAVSAALSVRWLVEFLNRHGLAAFGWYRIGLAFVLGTLIALGVVDLG